MTDPLNSKDLQTFMDRLKIPGEILILEVPTPTVEAAAQALGVQPRQIVKSVLFTVFDEGVLTITCGDQLVERRVIASLYGCSRKKVKLAHPDLVLELTGFAVGTVPPFGHRTQLRALLDPRVLEFDEIFAGGGTHHTLVRLKPQDIAKVTQADVVDLHTRPA
jgi:prolyl-tRNA editing enzyme YbaK/EbsC (Cys-tRNA(Pro) deacylase)